MRLGFWSKRDAACIGTVSGSFQTRPVMGPPVLGLHELENAEIIPFADIPAVYVEDSEVQLRLLGEIKRNNITNRYFT